MHNSIFCRYSLVEEYTETPMNPFTSSSSATGSTTPSPSATLTATPQPVNIIYSNQLGGSSSAAYGNSGAPSNSVNSQQAPTNNQFPSNNASAAKPSLTRKGGVIFPSIKNKPSVANSTFATDLITLKDVKVRLHCCCFDLLGP